MALAAVFAALSGGPVSALEPSFDCAKAQSSAEEAICSNDQLAMLDLELARLYRLAVTSDYVSGERLAELKAMQRGWIKGRDECWKASTDLETCVADSIAMRAHELRTGYADARSEDDTGISVGPFPYICEGLEPILSVVVLKSDPGIVSLRWWDTWVTAQQVPSASGAKYEAGMADGMFGFWMKGDEAIFTQPGSGDLSCKQDSIG